ncbi:hypothetical protein Ga0080574_TMP4353 [Salipiger abyssi]|uniref:Uncharacterized protein n=1 Tax=Salipiger abyssi TaxID=1250539 RepID=A0A1P8UZ76_9RHOB|nr:hypothetical protein Ga0080574_TMP4353 [Salipiger abyssi]
MPRSPRFSRAYRLDCRMASIGGSAPGVNLWVTIGAKFDRI